MPGKVSSNKCALLITVATPVLIINHTRLQFFSVLVTVLMKCLELWMPTSAPSLEPREKMSIYIFTQKTLRVLLVLTYRPRCCIGFLLAETPPTLIVTAQYLRREEETDVVPLPTEMVGGRTLWLSCLLTSSAVLLLGVSLSDVEASSCHQRTIHKRVGDAVELSTCLSPEKSRQLIVARWKKGETEVADKDTNVSKVFRDRFYLNPTNFSLRVRKLTLQDSGEFSFVSEVNNHQLQTVFITLQVHEPITQHPDLQVNSTWNELNESCRVLLECSSVYNTNVRYSLSVRNQTHSGSRLQFSIRPEDGETTFTCTISDFVSEMSAFKRLTCSNSTESSKLDLVLVLGAAVGGCALIVIIVGTAVGVSCCKRKAANMESNELTVYADVSEIAPENGSTMKPCSVYETIDNKMQPVTSISPGPHTVYDQIQLNRLRKTSSPYQEI
ncbi:uncharacterized protein LOC114851399 isoform X2 [Betta splendens]|uniref:Uncharacterized protein LOC114851399 isoform X2 n=1 Tax=Betta splendens TaxID=158456 RepID=A0A6P7LXT7_BETSP|nr:uncharacterized protein LOC114851399 isoform X2 [Betta splendens]